MEYDAFTPGEIDLSLGIKELQKLSKKANFAFLLTNLVDKKTKKPAFRPYFIKDVANLKIGLIGLISPTLARSLAPADKDKYEIGDYLKAAGQAISELKKKRCQVIIAIGHMEESEQHKLVQTYKEIYFVVGGHSRALKRQPAEVGNALIINVGTRGEYLGQMEFFLREKSEEKRLFSHYEIIALNDQYKDHPQVLGLVNQFLAETKKLYPPKTMSSFSGKDPWRQNRFSAYQVSNYMGDQFCLPCHEQQHEKWKKTGHAKAWTTLSRQKRETDHTCLPCHSTGFKEASGLGMVLENVQCESCHGPRRGHPEKELKSLPVSEKECLTCHNPAKSPYFNYATYLSKVRCPSSSLAQTKKKGE